MITLYDFPLSGNCHKVRLFLSVLKLPYQSVLVDVLADANHEPWFDAINPMQQIPVLVDDGFTIQDSQGILVYLAKRYGPRWFSEDPCEAGEIVAWLSFAAKEIATSLQAARLHHLVGEDIDIESAQREGNRVLHILERRLTGGEWLCLDRPTVADIACFPYVGLARDGGFALDEYPQILAWIERITRLVGYVSMAGLPNGPEDALVRSPW